MIIQIIRNNKATPAKIRDPHILCKSGGSYTKILFICTVNQDGIYVYQS